MNLKNLKYWDNKVIIFNNQKEAEVILSFLIDSGIKTKWRPIDNVYRFGDDVDAWKVNYQFKERQIGLCNINFLNIDDPKLCSGVLKYSDILKILRKLKLKKLKNEK